VFFFAVPVPVLKISRIFGTGIKPVRTGSEPVLNSDIYVENILLIYYTILLFTNSIE